MSSRSKDLFEAAMIMRISDLQLEEHEVQLKFKLKLAAPCAQILFLTHVPKVKLPSPDKLCCSLAGLQDGPKSGV